MEAKQPLGPSHSSQHTVGAGWAAGPCCLHALCSHHVCVSDSGVCTLPCSAVQEQLGALHRSPTTRPTCSASNLPIPGLTCMPCGIGWRASCPAWSTHTPRVPQSPALRLEKTLGCANVQQLSRSVNDAVARSTPKCVPCSARVAWGLCWTPGGPGASLPCAAAQQGWLLYSVPTAFCMQMGRKTWLDKAGSCIWQ